jgi:hypothetical protein
MHRAREAVRHDGHHRPHRGWLRHRH